MKRRKNSFITNLNIAVVLFSILLTLLFTPDKRNLFSNELNFLFPLLGMLNIFFLWFTTSRFDASWIRFDTLFLIGFMILHFQIPFLASIGIEPDRPDFVWIDKRVVNYATWLSTLAVLIFILGYLIVFLKKLPIASPKETNYKIKSAFIDYLSLMLFALFMLLVGKEFLGGSYQGAKNWGTGATYIALLLKVVLYLGIIYFFINTQHTKLSFSKLFLQFYKKSTLFAVTTGYFFLFLLIGDRGPVMELGILTLVCYSIYQQKIKFYTFMLLLFVASIAFTIIGLGRVGDVKQKESNVFVSGYEKLNSKETFNPTAELANSNRILYRALSLVPDYHPFLYGLTLVLAVVAVIPFISGIVISTFGIPEMYTNSSLFFTIISQGKDYSWGEGSEIIADIYINTGIYGVFIIMFLLGYFTSVISIKATLEKKHGMIILLMFMIISAIYMNRASFLTPLKSMVYALLLDRVLAQKVYFNL